MTELTREIVTELFLRLDRLDRIVRSGPPSLCAHREKYERSLRDLDYLVAWHVMGDVRDDSRKWTATNGHTCTCKDGGPWYYSSRGDAMLSVIENLYGLGCLVDVKRVVNGAIAKMNCYTLPPDVSVMGLEHRWQGAILTGEFHQEIGGSIPEAVARVAVKCVLAQKKFPES